MTIKLRPVRAGEDMVLTVEGGYMRKPVPEDGVVVETEENETYLPEKRVIEALEALERMRSKRRKAPRRVNSQQELPLAPESGDDGKGSASSS